MISKNERSKMENIDSALLVARIERPYYARAIAALTPIAMSSCGTMAVDDSWRLYYAPEYLEEIGHVMAGHIIAAHEVEHLLRDHGGRCKRISADPEAWNIAGDAEINDDVPAGYLPADAVYPASLKCSDGLLAEEYLDHVTKRGGSCGGGSGVGRTIDGELPSTSGSAPSVSPAEADRIRDQVAADALRHEIENGRGTVPSGILVWANARAAPVKIDWRVVLARAVRRSIIGRNVRSDNYTWSRLPRRQSTIMRPGIQRHAMRIAILVDTSGSMSEYGPAVLGIIHTLTAGNRVSAWTCDTEAHKIQNIILAKFIGGGGTDLRPGFAAATRKKCDALIVITDCETPWPEDCNTHAVIVKIGASQSSAPQWATEIKVTV